MDIIRDFLERFYEDIYSLPNFYLGIEDEYTCHVFSISFLIFLLLMSIFIIKTGIGASTLKKERGKIKKRINKMILGVVEEKDKNKKEKNI
jgi:hypothetical protein